MTKRLRMTITLGIATMIPLLMTPIAHAQVATVVASDNFNRANESPLVVGGNWQRFSAGGFVNLSGNEIAGVSGDALYYWQGSGVFDGPSQFARVKVTNAAGQVGLVLLGTGDQALVAAWNAGTLYIYWYSAGTYQGNLTTVASTLQNGDVVEALLDGGTVYAKVNELVVASIANTTTLSSGRPGFETFQAGAKLDDWAGGILAEGKCDGVPDGGPCDDGDACTQLDSCLGGECVGGNPVVCTPRDLCQRAGICDPATGVCANPQIVCNDNNNCTTDSCDPIKGCVYKPIENNCNDGNPCTIDSCDPAGGCLHRGSEGPDNSCGQVTDSSLCALPTGMCGTDATVPQFRLLAMQDPTFSTVQNTTVLNNYIINASNPGQFYYNVFHAGAPGAAVNLTIDVPFPFVTQGAHPIQVHGSAGSSGGCYVPGSSLGGFTITTDGGSRSSAGYAVILRSDYAVKNLGGTTGVHVTGRVPASGLVYVTIHLDYGFKRVSGWQQGSNGTSLQGPDTNLDGVLDGLGGGPIYLASPQSYGFGFSAGGGAHSHAPSSCIKFKRNHGVNGVTLALDSGNPVQNVKVELVGPTGGIVAATTSDRDGFYVFAYKHKGKTANYTVRLPENGKQKTVTLKANGYARADFDDLAPLYSEGSLGN